MTKQESVKVTPIVLAPDRGTRMRSSVPKVLHPILGRPMIWRALEAAQEATGDTPYLVIGHSAEQVRQEIGQAAHFILQEPQLGTGHAVMQAEALLRGRSDNLLVTSADMPLITPTTLKQIIAVHLGETANDPPSSPITLLTIFSPDTFDSGRVARNKDSTVKAIVEETQAHPQQSEIPEYITDVYCFKADWLWEALHSIPLSPNGEYNLTDLVHIAISDGLPVHSIAVEDPNEILRINTRIHLSEAEAYLRQRINRGWMLSGVTIIDPSTTYIEPNVKIGVDTVIWPNTYLHGSTNVGENCVIGPNSIVRDTTIGNHCQILFSVLESAVLEEDVDVGPFARLRKGAHLARGVHVGNFGEIKNSYLGPGTKMGHFSYIGDANIGPGVNIGAGVITANFDGKQKHPTEIGARAFIGSDTMLIAPVRIGEGAHTGAGAVVTKDVPPHTTAVGMPARTIRKKEDNDGP